jgi:uncharacterized RDD family membrane protein YckC
VSLPPTQSPYAPPASDVDPRSGAPDAARLATTGQRFANSLVDQTATILLSALAGGVLGFLGLAQPGPGGLAIGVAISLGYYCTLESLSGRTLGKLVTGTRVVSEAGGEPSLAQIFGRSCARMIPFEAFSFLGGAGRPVGWHDSLSGTRVIRIR